MNLATFLKAQDASILDSIADPGWAICAATTYENLELLATKRGRTIHRLTGHDDSFVVGHGPHKELWLRARLGGYRIRFKAFAQHEFGFAYPGNVPAGYNIDHLFSKGRTRRDSEEASDGTPAEELAAAKLPASTVVRMLLVRSDVNQSFGSLMEGILIGTGNPERPWRRFTSVQLAKALSIHPNPFGFGLSAASLPHIVGEFGKRGVLAALGTTPNEMLSELMSQYRFVNHNR